MSNATNEQLQRAVHVINDKGNKCDFRLLYQYAVKLTLDSFMASFSLLIITLQIGNLNVNASRYDVNAAIFIFIG